LRPGPSALSAHAHADGWVFEGDALWVSGWGLVDTFFTAARADDDSVVWALLDADGALTANPQELVAANASRTVTLHFDDVFVPTERVVGVAPLTPTSPDALRVNGALALGVARRCLQLLGVAGGVAGDQAGGVAGARDRAFHDELAACRDAMDTADDVPGARAHAADLTLRLASTLVVTQGARSILRDQHAQRLLREAAFLLVFGTRAPIQRALLERLTA
jgi:alkylation response protein AidB-like acyl-CoA dehydrogenase